MKSSSNRRRQIWAVALMLALVPIAAACLIVRASSSVAQTAPEPQPVPPVATPAPPVELQPAPTAGAMPATPSPSDPETPPAPRPLEAAKDPAAAKAHHVLETHCARCHQSGQLKRPAPAAAFGNILRLDDVVADPSLVQPGNPDGSRLYTHMLRRLMPFDVYQEQSGGTEPSVEELQAVRTWIGGLKPAPRCTDRQPMTSEEIATAVGKAAEKASWDVGRQRFISLAHLFNDCHSEEQMFAWRQAIRRLFNSLSWRPNAIRLEVIDEAKTLLRVDLGDLGWVAAHWDRITQSGNHPEGGLVKLPADLHEALGSKTPVVRGDWLANTVLKAPLYYDLLGLPEIGQEIQKILQFDMDAQRRAGNLLRAGVKPSQFSRSGRLIERFSTQRGVLWSAYDAFAREGQRDPSDAAITPVTAIPQHDATLTHFILPNGFPAFYALNARGQRIDQVPMEIPRRSIPVRGSTRVGLDCMACHGGGVVNGAADPAAAGPIATSATGDRTTLRGALGIAGVTADYSLDGVEPVVALARQFTRSVSLARLVAEFQTSLDVVQRAANQSQGPLSFLLRRVLQGAVPRSEIEAEFSGLLTAFGRAPGPDTVTRSIAIDDAVDPGPSLTLLSDKPQYVSGESLSLTVRSNVDCHLTLISINGRGRGTVIFPSDFEQNNLLVAGRVLRLPAEGAPYLFRLRERGRESVVAICSPTGGAIDGIRHDFERQRFTDVGDYSEFLAQAIAAEQTERKGQKAAAQPASDPRARGKQQRAPGRPAGSDVRPRSEQTARTAITFEVR